MPNNPSFSHICQVWQPEDCISMERSAPYDELLIEIYVTFMLVSSTDEADAESSVASPTTYKPFRQKLDHLVQDRTSWSTISNMLSQVNVPYHVQPFMIWKISKAARSMARDTHQQTIPMVVLIRVVVEVSDLESSQLSRYEDGGCGNSNSNTCVCVICLDEILVGAVSMPCSHVYHGDCIVHWLQRSRVCPLCRFPESRADLDCK